jgi:ceramide glucosyltransferase
MTMEGVWFGIEGLLLFLVAGGLVYHLLCIPAVMRFTRRPRGTPAVDRADWPPVTVLKPIYGLEKGLLENLRSICRQDYPIYQVVLSVQRLDDPAIPLLREVEREFGSELVTVVVADSEPRVNGRIQNLIGGYREARHDVIVFTDSDVHHRPDYLRTIVAPLFDREVGCSNTLYRATGARAWYERLEQLTLTGDFIINVIFAAMTGASGFCLGASTALRRETLERIGGLEALADYLVEDYEMGRRVTELGLRTAVVNDFVDTRVDLASPEAWWEHQVYWNLNTRAARPVLYTAALVTRELPAAVLFAIVRLFDPVGLGVLLGTLALRLGTMAILLGPGLRDRETLRHLPWLPVRDLLEFVAFFQALGRRRFVWRGVELGLSRHGRILPPEATR